MSGRDDDAANVRGPAPGGVGLVLIDVINPLDFEGAEALAPNAAQAAEIIANLRTQADDLGVPVIYVNDNYGHWGAEKAKLIGACAAATPAAKQIVDRLRPREEHYFVIKPQFSGFYATNLPVLLPTLGVNRIVLAGFAADICVLFTAADAHMRQYDLWIPQDAVASENAERTAWALEIMRKSMSAAVDSTAQMTLRTWIKRQQNPSRPAPGAESASGGGR